MTAASPPRRSRIEPAHVVIAAAICAALHVGKLPPAVTALQLSLSITLVQAGFLLSLVQLAGMAAGLAIGALTDALGLKRSMLIGLATLALASALGGDAGSAAALMALRAVEGFGFLLVVLPGPALVRQGVAAERLDQALGLWSTYMPVATALALLVGPAAIGAFGWRGWWWALAALTALMAVAFARAVPGPRAGDVSRAVQVSWSLRLRHTLTARGPWLVALIFSVYSAQWLAVIGFLPAIYQRAGVAPAAVGALTALVAAVNIVGNVMAGRLQRRGVAAEALLIAGFVAMALGAVGTFAALELPSWLRYAAVLLFSMCGGLIPGTLFAAAVRVAPGEHTISSTVGWMQQGSAFGQFCGPPLVAWLAATVGGWHWTWAVLAACGSAGIALSVALARAMRPR